jgi:3-methyladenine DNA glycosylase AlkD
MTEAGGQATIAALVAAIHAGLEARADPERREVTRGYFPSRLEILGVSAASMRQVIAEHRDAWKGLSIGAVVRLARALHAGGTHEGRQVGYEILERRTDAMAGLDRGTLEALGAGNDNWASVDTFATRVAGPAWREGRIGDEVVRDWAASDDRWWRRTAVVCTVALNTRARGGTGDSSRTLDLCTRVAGDPDPMVAKGVSWALRSLVAHDPAGVRAFLAEYDAELAALVKREVRNKLETGKKNP